jgi:ArsR family transcriptional regulator
VKKATARPSNRTDLMFRAFSDRTRLRILYLLQAGECCVGNLVEILELEQPSVSRHLAYLRRAGLVSVRKAGLWAYYSLAAPQTPFHQKLLECLGCCFSEVPEIQADQRSAAAVRSSGGCCPDTERSEPRRSSRGKKEEDCCPPS